MVLLGAGGMCFHLAQLHITNLFPRRRGMIASIFLAGFTGCAIIFYFLWLIFEKTGQTRSLPPPPSPRVKAPTMISNMAAALSARPCNGCPPLQKAPHSSQLGPSRECLAEVRL